jgi:carboxyl-terminal processing protease
MRRPLVVMGFVVVLTVTFLSGTLTGMMVRPALAADEPSQFSVFWEAWELVQDHFVDRDMIDPTKMTYGAIQGMLATLGDENHTVFFSPEEAQQQAQAMEGSFEGIGAYVDQRDGVFLIVTPMHGSPAEEAGLQPGDTVLKVDGEDISGLPEWEIVSRIRGPKGTSVVLTVLHANEKKPVEVTVIRDTIDVESVVWSQIPETDFVYLRVAQFASDTGDEIERVLKEIDAERQAGTPLKGILLDLRNNPGGLVSEVLRVNSQFLDEGTVIFHDEDAQGKLNTYRADGDGLARAIPLVVLINEATASGGEITAGALKENHRAQLLGQTTLGTGTVLLPFPLSDGSVLRLGVKNWLTPEKNLLKNQGVAPDTIIEQDASVELVDPYKMGEQKLTDLLSAGDKQFNAALLRLRLLVE